MKISNITTYNPPDAKSGTACIVRVDTDEGTTGYGECSPMNIPATTLIIHQFLRPLLIGKDPANITALEQEMMRRNYKFAGQLLGMACSGIELALWDIKGKVSGLPLHILLGGKINDPVSYYGSSMSRNLTPDAEADKLQEAIDNHGFRAVKFKLGSRMGIGSGIVDVRTDAERVEIIRKRLGWDVLIMVDGNSSFNASQAVELYERISQYDIAAYEEPCPYTDIAAYRILAQKTTAKINLGEQEWNLFQVKELISQGLVQFVACDVTKCGGLTNATRIAALCQAFGVQFVPHNTSRGIGLYATHHLAAAMPCCNFYQEYSIEQLGYREAAILDRQVPVDGKIKVMNAPGIGMALDEERLHKEWVMNERL